MLEMHLARPPAGPLLCCSEIFAAILLGQRSRSCSTWPGALDDLVQNEERERAKARLSTLCLVWLISLLSDNPHTCD